MVKFVYEGRDVELVRMEDMSIDEALALEQARGVGWDDLTDLARIGALVGVSLVRAGVTSAAWPAVLKHVPLGTVRDVIALVNAQEQGEESEASGDGEVLSPTPAVDVSDAPAA